MNLEGRICRLRAVEPRDVDTMYAWENDTEIWSVSGTTAPYSRELLERFVEQQQFDIWQTRQVRLMIEPITQGDGFPPCLATGMDNGSKDIRSRNDCCEMGIRNGVATNRTEIGSEAGRDDGEASLNEPAVNPASAKEAGVNRVSANNATGSLPVGALDLYEFDPQHRRAGVGILVHDPAQRGKGYAADALAVACEYAREVLGLHQLWCSVGAENAASLSLFRHAGFSEIGIKRDWLWTADGFQDEVLMQKILEQRSNPPVRKKNLAKTRFPQ